MVSAVYHHWFEVAAWLIIGPLAIRDALRAETTTKPEDDKP